MYCAKECICVEQEKMTSKALRFSRIIFFPNILSNRGNTPSSTVRLLAVQPSASIFDCLREHALTFFRLFNPIRLAFESRIVQFSLLAFTQMFQNTMLLEALRFSYASHVQSINVVSSLSSLIIKKSTVNFIIVLFVKSFHRYSGHEKPTGNL